MDDQVITGSNYGGLTDSEVGLAVKSSDLLGHLTKMLEVAGYHVAPYHGIAEILNFLSRNSGSPVILDADLLGGSYTETMREIRKVSQETTVAYLVGWWDERVPDLSGYSKYFIFTPLRQKQIEQVLPLIMCNKVAVPSARA